MANSTTGDLGSFTTGPFDSMAEITTPVSLEIPSSGLFGGNPNLQVAPDTATTLTGGDDQDVLVGGTGDDRLNGGEGDDVLVGGAGRNVLNGEGGNDVFGHAAGAVDIITDFAPGQGERLALADGLTVTTSEQQVITADLGTGTASHNAQLLTLSDGSAIALVGVTEAFTSDWLTSST